MNQLCVVLMYMNCHCLNSPTINKMGEFTLLFRPINRCIRRRIDDEFRFILLEYCIDLSNFSKITLVTRHEVKLITIGFGVTQGLRELACKSEYKNTHSTSLKAARGQHQIRHKAQNSGRCLCSSTHNRHIAPDHRCYAHQI